MRIFRVTADVLNARRHDRNSAISIPRGSIVPSEIINRYSEEQIKAHIAAGRIEEVQIENAENTEKELENKIMPKAEKKFKKGKNNEK